ncbi:MAG: M3 family metallopeptidase, partial [Candidatus Aminicenantes bacterium]|nr:M3 family metallopeptidase [Candidatus Aminicenantes bacterium]
VTAAAEAAKERGQEGKWVFTLHKPSLIPFLQYAENRILRENIYSASINVGSNGNEYDNRAIAGRMAALRAERAVLLGYETHAHFILEENMAKVPENVYRLLDQLWTPALNMAKSEAAAMQALIDKERGDFKLQSWDWWYYAEKVKKAKYDLDEEALRPYFKLENVIDGVFAVAGKLWGLHFEERTDIPKYHPDVKVFEVKEADGTHIGILYTDYFPRASKRGGAWMSAFRKQSRKEGEKITPVIVNCGNFSKPTADKPSLISMEEALTLFHEFGHALHGLLSDRTYPSLTGTDVPQDFVELPSQIMENWGGHPEVMKMYARHYLTNEPIPDELLEKLKKSKLFNRGFAETEYLAACYLDMDWHTQKTAEEQDCLVFEKASLDRIGLIPEIIVRYRSPYFRHIFSGGYSAGYYSYVWAEVLDADAFEAFKEKGLFDRETADRFRKYVLSAGGTDDPMVLYKRFRGVEPKVDAVLKRKGFLK